MACKYCGRPVVLTPSAAERARKFGGEAKDYVALFPNHGTCVVKARKADTLELLRRQRND